MQDFKAGRENIFPIIIEEHAGIKREREPVTFGIPFKKGTLFKPEELRVVDNQNQAIQVQREILNYWSDNSIKWLLLDFQVSVKKNSTTEYQLITGKADAGIDSQKGISIDENSDQIIIDTGTIVFHIGTHTFKPFERVTVEEKDVIDLNNSNFILKDNFGVLHEPVISNIYFETKGELRTTVRVEGGFGGIDGNGLVDFYSRINFYAGSSLIKLEFTIRNSNAAEHLGGLWDLGDKGSIYFSDLCLKMALQGGIEPIIFWKSEPHQPKTRANTEGITIYQDSSGGENWGCSNHVNSDGKVMNSFRGYHVYNDKDELIHQGDRADPEILLKRKEKCITGKIRDFWQNFPKAIAADNNILFIKLFPEQYNDVFELQGGEQKTHTLHLDFSAVSHGLDWTQYPIFPRMTPDYYIASNAFSYLSVYNSENNPLQNLIDTAVKGENTFFARREIIDEYGWRNFGDLFADHETYEEVDRKGNEPYVSHYNNQYDIIYGSLYQYVKSGIDRWFQLANDLAKHLIDIDINHTEKDRSLFNGGMFWHTDHFTDAATATHRSVSIETRRRKGLKSYGGGPGYDHNYTRGLLHFFYITGDRNALDAVLGLAEWNVRGIKGQMTLVESMEQTAKSIVRNLKKIKKREKIIIPYRFNGPGRTSGNALNVLLDAYSLTKNKNYLKMSEKLIRACIHPQDRIENRNLEDPNIRWFYTIFMQALGVYLDIKHEASDFDTMYFYATETLNHYAEWMLNNEIPFLSKPEILDYPNFATRSAQDLRKCNTLLFATKYSREAERNKYFEKASFFYNSSIEYLTPLQTKSLTRPLAILLQNAGMYEYFKNNNYKKEISYQTKKNNYHIPGKRVTAMGNIVSSVLWKFEKLFNVSVKQEIRFLKYRIKNIKWERQNK